MPSSQSYGCSNKSSGKTRTQNVSYFFREREMEFIHPEFTWKKIIYKILKVNIKCKILDMETALIA